MADVYHMRVKDTTPLRSTEPWRVRASWWLRLIVAVVVLTCLVFAGRNHFDELDRLVDIKPHMLAAIVAAFLAARWLNGQAMRQALRRLGFTIGLLESFMLVILMNYTNLLIPRVGLGAPAVYLKAKHGVSYTQFATLLLPLGLLAMTAAGVIGLICQAALWLSRPEPWDIWVAAIFTVAAAVGMAALFARLPMLGWWPRRLRDWADHANESWRALGGRASFVRSILVLHVAIFLLRAGRMYLVFTALGVEVNFLGLFIASLLADLMMLISITPAGLGFREAALLYSAQILGTTESVALSAAILDRAVWTVGVIVIAQFGLWRMVRPAKSTGGDDVTNGGAAEVDAARR